MTTALFYLPTLWHPLTGLGYQFWSGIASSMGILTGIFVFLYKHNCHEHRCWRIGWKEDSDGFHKCKVHHPDHPSLGWFRANKLHPRHASQKTKNN